MRRVLVTFVLLLGVACEPTSTTFWVFGHGIKAYDCNADGRLEQDDLDLLSELALSGADPADRCAVGDTDRDGTIRIHEVVEAVDLYNGGINVSVAVGRPDGYDANGKPLGGAWDIFRGQGWLSPEDCVTVAIPETPIRTGDWMSIAGHSSPDGHFAMSFEYRGQGGVEVFCPDLI